MAAGSGWIDQRHVNTFAPVVQLAEQTFQRSFQHSNVVLVVERSAGARIHHGAGLRFDSDDAGSARRQEGRKEPYPTVAIQYDIRALRFQHSQNALNERGGLNKIDLEERVSRDAETSPQNDIGEELLSRENATVASPNALDNHTDDTRSDGHHLLRQLLRIFDQGAGASMNCEQRGYSFHACYRDACIRIAGGPNSSA